MKKRALIGMALTLALALVASTALAGPWGGRFYGMGPMLQNLTPEQSSQILAAAAGTPRKSCPHSTAALHQEDGAEDPDVSPRMRIRRRLLPSRRRFLD
ncbi:MAG: hypothetical protein MZV70_02350 [Desulfobacterales bacterium]|nr:hypothetical protein [Desulfobacterales bacterium]